MNKDQAIEIIRQVVENFKGTYRDHIKLQEALKVISQSEESKSAKKAE